MLLCVEIFYLGKRAYVELQPASSSIGFGIGLRVRVSGDLASASKFEHRIRHRFASPSIGIRHRLANPSIIFGFSQRVRVSDSAKEDIRPPEDERPGWSSVERLQGTDPKILLLPAPSLLAARLLHQRWLTPRVATPFDASRT
ncbi:hypothetical protein RRG08_014712 [Elysia crispata]|uniref:Uncharacterized protein n=1 Tax=Elysia crispata TaxID=231223 RepID=A0AAE1CZ34_9GAST|nr:hypothetical protein RRG08_014712 [Elysia crispata]